MRRILAVGCCALHLAFGFAAGAAHVHESADHHAESRGLHLDHAHLGDSADHELQHHREHPTPQHGESGSDPGHFDHHAGDVLYLSATALRTFYSNLRLVPATASFAATNGPPRSVSILEEVRLGPPSDPPRTSRSRPRAPPA